MERRSLLLNLGVALMVGGAVVCIAAPAEARTGAWALGPAAVAAKADAAGEQHSGSSTHAAHGAEAEQSPIDPLNWRTDLAIWTAVVFLLLLLVLGKFAWGPIATNLEKREQRIADQIAAAERERAEARQLLEQYQQQLDQAGKQVQQMLDEARRNAEHTGQQIVEKARAEAEAEHRRRLEEIDQAAADAIKELARRSTDLAVELAGKILRAQLDPAAHTRLIEQAVAQFTKGEASPSTN